MASVSLHCQHLHVVMILTDFFDADNLQAVLQDLFPGVDIPEHDYGRLQEEIENVIVARHLQVVPDQVMKVIQLYETMLVRHGVMLVGPTGSGKTTDYQVDTVESVIFLSTVEALAHQTELIAWVGTG